MAKSKIEKIQSGIDKYQYLRRRLFETDVSTDKDFQKAFNGFFRMGRRSEDYYADYYWYLQQNKMNGINFADALAFLYNKYGKQMCIRDSGNSGRTLRPSRFKNLL